MENGYLSKIAELPTSGIKGILGHFQLTNRMLRMEPRCAGRLSEQKYIVSVLGKLWLVDISQSKLVELRGMRQGYSLISFCVDNGRLYWGEYGANPSHNNINIYCIDSNLNLNIVYTFPKGTIRHIHGIIKDGDGFIVMTGDNEDGAGIYRVNTDWTQMEPWKIGEQKYRAVVGFPFEGGLLYATDSVETENHLRLIEADGNEHILTPINGSCIYGCETKDYFLFSTTVESHEGGGLRKLFSNELGGGIKSRDVHILAVDKQNLGIRVVKKYRKDIWPMKLFQYGRVTFAGGQTEATEGVWCYPIACVGTKGQSEYIRLYDE